MATATQPELSLLALPAPAVPPASQHLTLVVNCAPPCRGRYQAPLELVVDSLANVLVTAIESSQEPIRHVLYVPDHGSFGGVGVSDADRVEDVAVVSLIARA